MAARASPQKKEQPPASCVNTPCTAVVGATPQATSVAEEGPAKKVPRTAASAANSAASGANPSSPNAAAAGAPAQTPVAATLGPMLVSDLLQTGFSELHEKYAFSRWATETKAHVDVALLKFLRERKSKVSFHIPSDILLLAPLDIKAAASGANLTSFREAMNFDNLTASFSQSSVYEGAGTVFMLDFTSEEDMDPIGPAQLENALYFFLMKYTCFRRIIPYRDAMLFTYLSPLKLWTSRSHRKSRQVQPPW
jgi:hypothetical protein